MFRKKYCNSVSLEYIVRVRTSHLWRVIFVFVSMDLLSECVLRSFLITRKDLFGEDATFELFEVQEFGNKDGYQSSQRFGRIVYSHHHKTKYSNSLLLKIAPRTVLMKEFSMLQFFNEVVFYTRILPFLQTSKPEIGRLFPEYHESLLQYHTNSDEAVIVFENLQSRGYTPPEKYSFLDYDHLKLMMKKLGVFHAYSYRARERTPNKFRALILSRAETDGNFLKQFRNLSEYAMRGFEPLTTDSYYGFKIEKLRLLIENCDEVYTQSLIGDEHNCTHVFCHGDFLRNNVLFRYEKGKPIDLKMVDLATWRFASPVTDLALVLYLNADQKMRDENWNNLIDEYYTTVSSTFPETRVPSKSSILAEFKTKAVRAYAIASYFLPSLIASDNEDVPAINDLLPEEYKGALFTQIPQDIMIDVMKKEGGVRATTALTNILKDIIDRGFVV